MPKYSIIIPVYKAESYLRRCVKSILSQTIQDWELILVDDGSPDNSGTICDEFAKSDKRIRVYHKENGGVSTARNLGIEKATGVWLCFVDSDDWVDRDHLEAFACPDNTNPKAIFVQGIGNDVPDGRVMNNRFSYPQVSFLSSDIECWKKYEILKNGCPVSKLFNRQLIYENALRYDEQLTLNEDHLFVTNYYRFVDEIHLVSASSYHYYYDYKVESLTKKFHSSNEYLNIANRIDLSLVKLCDKLCVPPSAICSKETRYIYGLGQIISAGLSSISEKNSFNKYTKCIMFYKAAPHIKETSGIDGYSLISVFFMKHNSLVAGYVCAGLYYYYYKTNRFVINIIKRFMLRC